MPVPAIVTTKTMWHVAEMLSGVTAHEIAGLFQDATMHSHDSWTYVN